MIKTGNASRIAFAGILAALSFVIIMLGSVMWIFAYTAPLFCGIIMMAVNKTLGKKYAVCIYVTVGILSMLFSPDKEAGLVYIFFFGYYPIIKEALEKIKPRFLSYFVKLIIFNAGILSSQLILIYILGIEPDSELGRWGLVIFAVLFNVLFVTYEFMYKALFRVYTERIEKRINKLLKNG